MNEKENKDLNKENRKLRFTPLPNATEEIAKTILDSAYQVHSALGPGLLESVYEACLMRELELRNISVASQVILPVIYKGMKVDSGYRIDLVVENCVVVEIKSSENVSPVHYAQLLTYIKLANIRLGLLLNFNVIHLRNGIKRVIN